MVCMDREKIISLRNFFFAAFIIGLIFAFSISGRRTSSESTGKEFGRLVLLFFIRLRVVLVFFFLVPALALHWMVRGK